MTRITAFFFFAFAACGGPAPAATCPEPVAPEPAPAVGPEPVAAATHEPEAPPAEEVPESEARVVVGECDLRGVPDAYREEVTEEQTAELAERMQAWLRTGDGGFGLGARHGIAFAKTEDDQGADPPYPSWSSAQGVHACGLQAQWLAGSLRGTFELRGGEHANGPITCQGNVCCYLALGEYDSAGGAVFSHARGRWELRAVYQVADNGTLGEDFIAAGYETVNRQLTRLAGRQCREPAGLGDEW